MTPAAATPPLEVLVPRGRDPFADYSRGVPGPGAGGHPPVNFHAMAAATGGRFHSTAATIPAGSRFVLVLLPRRLSRAYLAVAGLKRGGRRVVVSWKECGAHQIARRMRRPMAEFWLRRILTRADAVLCPSPAAIEFFGGRRETIPNWMLPTPYPVDEPGWSFERPLGERAGIFLGTRDWETPCRRHEEAARIALGVAERAGCRVTAINLDGEEGRRRYAALGVRDSLRIVDGPLPYARYLEEIASHRVVVQRDACGVPGQVAGDALLCGLPCTGGNGMVDRIAFGDLPGGGASGDEVAEAAARLLADDTAWTEAASVARARALERLSFPAFRRSWSDAASTLNDLTVRRPPA